jgi:methionyl-tRNA formyltransferase
MRIVLVAEEAAGVQTLTKVTESADHDLVAVMASSESSGVARAAAKVGVPVWDSREVREAALAERMTDVDVLLNVHSLFRIHPAVVAAPAIGSFNLHPGPLPRYAGLNAPSWAIYFGERRHAVTLHWMVEDIDAGNIAYDAWFDVSERDTGLTLSATCARRGLELVGNLLADLPDIPAQAQEGEGRYFGREVPHGGRLPWSLPARRIVDFVRACDYGPFASPWGRPTARLDGREVEVLRAATTSEPADAPPGTVGDSPLVAAADEWVAVERIRVDGQPAETGEVLVAGQIFDAETASETADSV